MKQVNSFDKITTKLREFFKGRDFVEVFPQCNQSILAACEDPKTIATYEFSNVIFPMKQTNQMDLEFILMQNPNIKGLFCLTTSYRNEPNPVPGRHDKIFGMFEFESRGGFKDLLELEFDLVEYLGFGKVVEVDYNEMCDKYGVDILEAEHETLMWKEYGNAIALTKFPRRTSPFWNMRSEDGKVYNKSDILLCGMETIGSAERSTNKEDMKKDFYTISNGMYAKLLFDKFGKDRVEKELNEFFELNMVERFGAGMGLTRLERAMQLTGLL